MLELLRAEGVRSWVVTNRTYERAADLARKWGGRAVPWDDLESALPAGLYRTFLFVMPPQTALQDVYQGLLLSDLAWGSVVYVLGYAAVWLVAGVLVLFVSLTMQIAADHGRLDSGKEWWHASISASTSRSVSSATPQQVRNRITRLASATKVRWRTENSRRRFSIVALLSSSM